MKSKIIMDDTKVSKPVILMKYGDSEILSNHGICVIKGQGGSGKSRLAMNMVIGLSGKDDKLGFNYNVCPPDQHVVYVNTEMSDYHIKKRRLAVSAITGKKYSSHFICMSSVGLAVKDIISDLNELCTKINPYIIIFDQIGDLVNSVNDEGNAKELFKYFENLAAKLDCGIIIMIHQNEDSKHNSKGRGHLGSLGEQKAVSSIAIYKSKSNFIINSTKVREGSSISIKAEYDETTSFLKSSSLSEVQNLEDLVKQLKLPSNASDLDQQIMTIENCANSTARARKSELVDKKLITCEKEGRELIYRLTNSISFNLTNKVD